MPYDLEFLPLAEKDIRTAAMYIANDLKAPIAAANLVRKIRSKTNNLRKMPYMYREYREELQNETIYRAMPVKKYIVFYTVNEEKKTVEIHRVIYARTEINALLK